MATTSGTRCFKIHGNSQFSKIYNGAAVQCGTFTVRGYEWAILYRPYQKPESFIEFNVQLLSEIQRFVHVFLCFCLVGQNGRESTTQTKSGTFICYKKGDVIGFSYFMKRSDLDSSIYLKNDSFTIQCNLNIIEVFVEDVTNKISLPVPPSDLQQHLDHLLQSGEGADISFKVKEETFPAHRIILAARSSVFRAELFGSMRESEARCIEIEEMEPEVFKALLRFIYTDKLHSTIGRTEEAIDEINIVHHLIVAADRYDLNRLRFICEEILANKIGPDNVVTTLALAARHNCRKLEEICLDYISSSEVVHSITSTDEFERLIMSCPSICKELLGRLLPVRTSNS